VRTLRKTLQDSNDRQAVTPAMTEPYDGLIVGVDVGGTKVAAGLVDSNGEIKSQTRTAMVGMATPPPD